jgi:hypothetical protein
MSLKSHIGYQMTFLPEFSAARDGFAAEMGTPGTKKSTAFLLWGLNVWQDKGEGIQTTRFSITLGVPLWAPLREIWCHSMAQSQNGMKGTFLLQSKHLDITKKSGGSLATATRSVMTYIKKYNDQIGARLKHFWRWHRSVSIGRQSHD